MSERLKVGDIVSWSSEAGKCSGTIIKIHTLDFEYKGQENHATGEEPKYEIKINKSGRVAIHKATALTRIENRFS